MLQAVLKKKLISPQGWQELSVDLKVTAGEFVTLFGKSGEGKTTILRMLSGLTAPEEGYIEVAGQVWFDSRRGINLPPQKRSVGYVFQEYTLFPHMTVRQNLEYALVKKDTPALKLIEEYLEMMDLKKLEHTSSTVLSGGQKQRVALLRVLLRQPKILLLDEPLSALDLGTRLQLQDELVKIHEKNGITTIFVSHDYAEIFKLSGRLFILENGKISKTGPPNEVLIGRNWSGKFKFIGEILEITADSVVNILTIAIGQNITKVVATNNEVKDLKVGDKVIIGTKAFNPIVIKATGQDIN